MTPWGIQEGHLVAPSPTVMLSSICEHRTNPQERRGYSWDGGAVAIPRAPLILRLLLGPGRVVGRPPPAQAVPRVPGSRPRRAPPEPAAPSAWGPPLSLGLRNK